MALPDPENMRVYFEKTLIFLEKYEWIYNFQITQYFVKKAWLLIPAQWKEVIDTLSIEELNTVPFGHIQDDWPESLRDFLREASQLTLLQQQPLSETVPVSISKTLQMGMNPKKIHEVSHMAAVIAEEHEGQDSSLVVDVGSGLGYLGQVLSSHCGIKTLGLEGNDKYSHGAATRTKTRDVTGPGYESVSFQLRNDEPCFSAFKHLLTSKKNNMSEFGTIDGMSSISSNEKKNSDKSDVDTDQLETDTNAFDLPPDTASNMTTDHFTEMTSLVGLHCCGDLTPTMMRLFTSAHDLQNLICVGCCYHRMTQENNSFYNFPISNVLKEIYKSFRRAHQDWYLGTVAFRLASQETRSRWKQQTDADHNFHMKNVAYRSILEVFFTESDQLFKKHKRKVAHRDAYKCFEDYIDVVMGRINLEGDGKKGNEGVKERLCELHQQYKPFFSFIEVHTCLQVVIQPVLESLILMDRVSYLQECGIKSTIKAIMSDNISPRNMAIIAWKQK